MAKKEMDSAQILRHLEDDMGDLLGLFDIPDVYEIMLNAFRRADGMYEGHIWYEQAGKGMVRLINTEEVGLRNYPIPNIGDKVFVKYLDKDSERIILNHHVIPANNQARYNKEVCEAVGMLLKHSLNIDSENIFLEQEEHYRLCEFTDYISEVCFYGHKEPIPEEDFKDLSILIDKVNKKLSRLIHIYFRVEIVTITKENIISYRQPKHLVVKEFVKMTESKAHQIMNILAAANSMHFHAKEPRLECAIPFYHHRFTGQIPPFVKFPSFTIRKHSSKVFTLDEYVATGIMPQVVADTIRELMQRGCNILIAGGVGSGKTTLLNALLWELAWIHPEALNRVGIIEDTPEVQNPIDNAFEFAQTNEVGMDDALKSGQRSRPNSIIVGEVRGKEGYTLFKAMLTGQKNCMGTIHANGAIEAAFRFEQCIKEHQDCRDMPVQRDQISMALNAVISIQRTTVRITNKAGHNENVVRRKVTALMEITGYDPKHNLYEWIPYYLDKEAILEQATPAIEKLSKYQ